MTTIHMYGTLNYRKKMPLKISARTAKVHIFKWYMHVKYIHLCANLGDYGPLGIARKLGFLEQRFSIEHNYIYKF